MAKKETQIEDLKGFNEAMLARAVEEIGKLEGCSNKKFFRFDFEKRKPVIVRESYKNNIPGDRIEYYWIEYKKDDVWMKLTLFFKDVDTNTHNVHVVPGIIENYELKDNIPLEEPYADIVEIENKKVVIIRNVKSGTYPSFAEKCDNGWWCPCPDSKCIPLTKEKRIDRSRTISGFDLTVTKTVNGEEEVFKDYFLEQIRDFGIKSSKNITDDLKKYFEEEKKDPKRSICDGLRPTERYNPICWYNIKVNGKKCSMYLTQPIYFSGYGFFTQYHCIAFGKDEKDIIIKCPVVERDTKEYKEQISLAGNLTYEEIKPALEDCIGEKID